GTYSIAITAVAAPQTFAINIGDTIQDGTPSPGAGNIEFPASYDIYTFAGTAGDSIFIDKIAFSGTTNIDYTLIDPSGNELDSHELYQSDLGSIELPETGSYTLQVGDSSSDQTGTYSIAITAVAAPQTFAINIG
ncbi:PPC domain-containing protein, partial [Coraliomargarita sp. SDUM461004]